MSDKMSNSEIVRSIADLVDALAKYDAALVGPESDNVLDELAFANSMMAFDRAAKNWIKRHGKNVLAALSGDGWMPIESAPKDGTEYLGYDAKRNKFDVCVFIDSPYVGHTAAQSDGEYGAGPDEFETPTHWQPLPPPPTESGA